MGEDSRSHAPSRAIISSTDHLATKLELKLLEDRLELQVKMLEERICENRVLCDNKEKIAEVKSVLDHICPGSFETMSDKDSQNEI